MATLQLSLSVRDQVRAEERAARARQRQLERAQRAAAEVRERSWRARLDVAIRETGARYPMCRCQLRPSMTRDQLRDLEGGCSEPRWVCPRLDAVRRRVGL